MEFLKNLISYNKKNEENMHESNVIREIKVNEINNSNLLSNISSTNSMSIQSQEDRSAQRASDLYMNKSEILINVNINNKTGRIFL